MTPILAEFQNEKWLNNGIFGNGETKICK
ncbi:MAG: hypothetical protein PWP44_837, partial [Thermacetogenium sp.]|nr:hypothetical protein [Thermacetogenium sp.]